ncbi:MAG: hypothetical protein R3F02_18825 [Thiolinea sp.]
MFEAMQLAAYQDEKPNFSSRIDSISSLLSNRYIRVPQNTSDWVVNLGERLNSLTSLPPNWDGYSGVPVSFDCAQFAANLIEQLYVDGVPAPQLVPGSDGTLQMEWHVNQFDIEIDILAPYDVTAMRYDLMSDTEEELKLKTDFSVLARACRHETG